MDVKFVKQLTDYVNKCVLFYAQDSAHMKYFLKFLAYLRSDISITNKVIVCGYNPESTEVRSAEEWAERNVHIVKPDERIHTPVCIDKENRIYEDRIMYDISATDGKPESYMQYRNIGTFVEWVLRFPPCPVRFLEEHKPGKGKAEYMPDKQEIEVTRGFVSEAEVCHLILREYAHYYIHEKHRKENEKFRYDRRTYGVDAFSVAYAICLRFGVAVPKLENIQPDSNLQPKDILGVFDGLDYAICKVSDRIEHGPELRRAAEEKARKEKEEIEKKRRKEEKERKEKEAKAVDPGKRPMPPELQEVRECF